jgi:phosphatidylglycerol:prolipoprotein diacylglycerol transferase
MYPVLLKVGPLTIYSFGVMMALGFLTAGYFTSKELERKGLNGELGSALVFWAAVGGLIFSRLWSILEDWRGLLRDPLSVIFSGSGFVWYGGLIGGTLGVTWVVWRNGLPWLKAVDSASPGLALGQAIGRMGCQLAGDGDWGKVSDLPWAMAYPKAIIGWPHPAGVRVHPTPLYELLAYVLVFAVLWAMRKKSRADGRVFWWYLVLAPTARFLVEFVRVNRPVLLGLTAAQLFSVALVAVGFRQLWYGRRAARNRAVAVQSP